MAPIAPPDRATFENVLAALLIDRGSGPEYVLNDTQRAVAVAGLSTRIQLLQGPPGTGKTQTTASAVLLRIQARRRAGTPRARNRASTAGDIVLIAAHTHNAIDELLKRLYRLQDSFHRAAIQAGGQLPTTVLAKVFTSSEREEPLTICVDETTGRMRQLPVQTFAADSCKTKIKDFRQNAVLVIAGTTGAILKMAEELDGSQAFPNGFTAPVLIVDEASMLAFPHFLALTSLVEPQGEILLAGDHRQLAPIVAHDWKNEDRPTVEAFQPHLSAYEALDGIKSRSALADDAVLRCALEHTFRLPYIVRKLIEPTYLRDGIALKGRPHVPEPVDFAAEPAPWRRPWLASTGLFLVAHDERRSRKVNPVELEAVERLVRACPGAPASSVAIVTPHRAQRNELQLRLADIYGQGKLIRVIDTVEKLQGAEASTIIVTATASDPSAIGRNAEFILSLNRANVAFSRTIKRLIVVCASTLLDHMPIEVDLYDDTVLWKTLRMLCTREIAVVPIEGFTASVRTTP